MSSTWLSKWEPENPDFWEKEGKQRAWKTLIITTIALTFSFATWFVVSAVVVRLPGIGFKFSQMELFWLAAMPGLSAGILRIINTFLIPIFGTRHVITTTIFLKLIPMLWLVKAINDPTTSFAEFLTISFLCGLGGGDFSSYMPSTSLFFPKRLQGVALGIQAGIGNFGVSLTQFVTPIIIGSAVFGSLIGGPQEFHKGETVKQIWLQNAAFWYVPVLIVVGIVAWFMLKSVPVKASFKEQLDIFNDKHTWYCTIIYVMTFGSFAGLSAAFPMMIKELYGKFPDAPDPLKYAFYGPLIGSVLRVVFGSPSDKWGGSLFTLISGLGLIICSVLLIFSGALNPASLDQFNIFVTIMLALFFFTGIGNASTFRQFPIAFAFNARKASGVIGFTAAIAAFGPFIFNSLIGSCIKSYGSPVPFFWGAIIFYVIATYLNWKHYFLRSGERFDRGNSGGTWWDKAKTTYAQ
jgi:NNP family nitrate/nitrite transporter-like MFS transporter